MCDSALWGEGPMPLGEPGQHATCSGALSKLSRNGTLRVVVTSPWSRQRRRRDEDALHLPWYGVNVSPLCHEVTMKKEPSRGEGS